MTEFAFSVECIAKKKKILGFLIKKKTDFCSRIVAINFCFSSLLRLRDFTTVKTIKKGCDSKFYVHNNIALIRGRVCKIALVGFFITFANSRVQRDACFTAKLSFAEIARFEARNELTFHYYRIDKGIINNYYHDFFFMYCNKINWCKNYVVFENTLQIFILFWIQIIFYFLNFSKTSFDQFFFIFS